MAARKKLNIGIVCYPSVGGSGIVATGLGSELARRGHRVHFISYDPPFALERLSKNIFFHKMEWSDYELFKFPDYTLPLAVKMVEVAEMHKLDIMHVHYAVPHATAALLAKSIARAQRTHFPNVVATLHGTDITLLARDKNIMPVIRYSIEASCGVTAVSESLKKDTYKYLRIKRPIKVIYNFYTPEKPSKSPAAVRRSLGVKPDDFLAIHLSNLRKVKRIPDLLKIMALVRHNPRIKLLVLAGGDWRPYEKLAKKLGLGGRIIIRANVRDIENYLNAADAGIYTSEDESFGMGMLETMAYGKPVLATRVGGVPEVMKDGETGYLFGVGKAADFAKALVRLAGDPKLVRRLGMAAARRARTQFSADKIVEDYLAYYRHIISTC